MKFIHQLHLKHPLIRTCCILSIAILSNGCDTFSDAPAPDQHKELKVIESDDQADELEAQALNLTPPEVTTKTGETVEAQGPVDAKEEEVAGPPAEHHERGGAGAPHPGPWLWVTRTSAAIYSEPKPDRDKKLGYVKRGGQVPILDGKVEGPDCPRGWIQVASGGYICSHVGTTNKDDKDVKFRPNQPNAEEILPYPYMRNAHNGTPLYKSIPSREQTYKYEPYLPGAIKAAEEKAKAKAADYEQMRAAGLEVEEKPSVEPVPSVEDESNVEDTPKLGAKLSAEDQLSIEDQLSNEAKKPIWEREDNLHEVTLDELRSDSDDILAGRMMKGFYIAVDKTFKWDGRTWYKTTKGLITPADRFWATDGSDFHGVEIDGETITLPIGWVVGVNKSAPTYDIDTGHDIVTAKGSKDRFEMLPLQYRYHQVGDVDYFQMKDGTWIRDRFVRMTTPGKRPDEVGPNERWVDVDISEQTLVVFEGDRPVYATLLSSGKESKDKTKDHSTPRGMWRVREKHLASTMDGDGSAAGDLPYSIEDVPYIMYFYKSYATHGAFWHRNYGTQMSHGCVNLAPLDAKWLFFYADPQVPEGVHGNWSTTENPGSMIVVHD